jgi:tyrosyl-tRNA synthetase
MNDHTDTLEKKHAKNEEFELIKEEMDILQRGTAEIISSKDLAEKLLKSKKTGVPLKIKLGIDPTAPHVHLGFAVVLRKLRKFQDLGHRVQLLIGDFTARVGDPTGRSETRKMLTPEEISRNAESYRDQLSLILDPERTDVVFNSQWLEKLNFSDILHLTSKYTVARILERDDFAKRYNTGKPLGMHEILYPLMQGYDSVVLESDVEMGGTDQKFNILVGRDLQREYGKEPQVVFLMPILEGTDGVLKMSKSYGNYIGITEPPNEMFGKVMSIPDHLIFRYFELCTDVPMEEVKNMEKLIEENKMNPRDAKMRLGKEIVAIYHDSSRAEEAAEEFIRVFSKKEIPADMPIVRIPESLIEDGNMVKITDMIMEANLAPSKREARRLIQQGAVKIDGEKYEDPTVSVKLQDEMIMQVGNRKFVKIISNK